MAQGSLQSVPRAALERVLRLSAQGRLACPLTATQLDAAGVPHAATVAGALSALDAEALRIALRLVLAEREGPRVPTVELVWTGPDTPRATARDTAVLLRGLFEDARESVLIAGYRFSHGARLLEPLHCAMRERGVRAELFVDLPRAEGDHREGAAFVRAFRDDFLRDNWPFGPPLPRLYHDPRQAHPSGRYASLHAKCVVVDARHTLVTSANFTDRGHTRNHELGVRIEDPELATRVLEQWGALVRAGRMVAIG